MSGVAMGAVAGSAARLAGRISEWHEDKGYGFVVPHDGGARAFVHVTAFQVGARRPSKGDLISYALATDAKGRSNAVDVRFAGQRIATPPPRPRRQPAAGSRRIPRRLLGVLALVAVGIAAAVGRLPAIVALLYAALSGVSYLTYWYDKDAANAGRWRVQEGTLHMWDLFGGWPGALIAQQQFRHKTVKGSFQAVFWVTVVVNLVGMAWMVRTGLAQALSRALLR